MGLYVGSSSTWISDPLTAFFLIRPWRFKPEARSLARRSALLLSALIDAQSTLRKLFGLVESGIPGLGVRIQGIRNSGPKSPGDQPDPPWFDHIGTIGAGDGTGGEGLSRAFRKYNQGPSLHSEASWVDMSVFDLVRNFPGSEPIYILRGLLSEREFQYSPE